MMEKSKKHASLSKLAIPLAITGLAALAVGVIVGSLLVPTPTPQGLDVAAAPDMVKATRQTYEDKITVPAVTFETSPVRSVTAKTSGTVSESSCKAGQAVHSGDKLMSVDGKPIIALHTDTPLYRSVSSGASGADVAALQRELSLLGYSADGNGVYGKSTANGVSQLLKHAGISNAGGSIGPEDVVWIPESTVVPTQCSVDLNAALSPDVEVMKVGGQLTAVTFRPPTGLRAGRRTFSLFDVTIGLDKVDGRITDATFLSKISASQEYQDSLADKSKKPNGLLALEKPIETMKVPPSAIVGQDGETACVSPDGKKAIPVNVIGSALGATLVQPSDGKTPIGKVVLGHRLDGVKCTAGKADKGGKSGSSGNGVDKQGDMSDLKDGSASANLRDGKTDVQGTQKDTE
ncbi:peptidoglycan-binding domain-containing protein [Bifidobacterium sp. ESL0728]|uniref:peptidoglycan-binding domain-containing protein n=1 Tax=Bifidobacterium sp. ESL0728 TaxID=2983220 RepID=UPI0023F697CB|nr:peptidoglycan-binding domain-containing protein [Bifidobacterium sp. ESL0728]WEV59155.1 peptidoglycan-binding domain-containing protein [Bifidobacterium sp. ESL0728]